MSFTVADARRLAESFVGQGIEDQDAVLWAQAFCEELPTTFWPEATQPYATSVANTFYALPAAFVNLIEVQDSAGNTYEDYAIRSKQIKFADADSYTLYYRANPTAITTAASTVTFSDLLKRPMACYFSWHFTVKNPEATPVAIAMWEGRYKEAKREVVGKVQDSTFAGFRTKLVW